MNLNLKSDSVKSRLFRGLSASALGPVVTAVVQLGSVPLFLHAWGAARYGDWLLLFAIPNYLTLSDLGFGAASGSDMCMKIGAGDRHGALRTFQSSWVLVSLVSVSAFMLTVISVWWIPWARILKLSSLNTNQAAAIIAVLAAYIVVAQQNGVIDSGFTSDGHFSTVTFWMAILRFREASIATIVAVLHGSLFAVAMTYLCLRSIGTISLAFLLLRKSPWIRFGTENASLRTVRDLAAPALGFIALPLGYGLSLQGSILIVGAVLGPIAVVSFSTLRTLTRVSTQLIGVIKNAIWPELSRAFGSGNVTLARSLHRYACQAALLFSALGGIALWVFGPSIYGIWTKHAIPFEVTCFHILLIAVVTNALWDTSSVVPMSVNAHLPITFAYSITAAFSLTIAWFLTRSFGLSGTAVTLLISDALMSAFVLKTSLRLVEDNIGDFGAHLFVAPRLRRATC